MDRLPSPVVRLLRSYPYALLFSVLAVLLGVVFCLRERSDWEDVYIPAAERFLAGKDVFRQSYMYPPLPAFLVAPCTLLAKLPARLVYYTIDVASIGVLLLGAWRLSGGRRLQGDPTVPRREHVIFWLGLLCGLAYINDGLHSMDLIVSALVIGGCLLLDRTRFDAGAGLFGLAAGLKCTPLLWGPYLAWRGRRRAAVIVFAVALAVNFVPDLVVAPPKGTPRLVRWVGRYLAPMTNANHDPGTWGSSIIHNHSVAGVCNRWLTAEATWQDGLLRPQRSENRVSPTVLKLVTYSVCLLLVLAAVFACGKRNPLGATTESGGSMRWALEYSLVLLLMVLLSPQSSKSHYCTLVLPGFCVARLAVERRDRVLGLLLIGSIGAAMFSGQDLWGVLGRQWRDYVTDSALWYSNVFWETVLLFAACCYARGWVVTASDKSLRHVEDGPAPSAKAA